MHDEENKKDQAKTTGMILLNVVEGWSSGEGSKHSEFGQIKTFSRVYGINPPIKRFCLKHQILMLP